jgi:hypothetical protein
VKSLNGNTVITWSCAVDAILRMLQVDACFGNVCSKARSQSPNDDKLQIIATISLLFVLRYSR